MYMFLTGNGKLPHKIWKQLEGEFSEQHVYFAGNYTASPGKRQYHFEMRPTGDSAEDRRVRRCVEDRRDQLLEEGRARWN